MSTTDHRPVLIVIAGPNGSGKTTITSKILRHEWLEDAVYINPDQVAQDKFGDWNSPEAVMQAAQYCEQQREQCLHDRQSLIFETVLSSEGKVDLFGVFTQRSIRFVGQIGFVALITQPSLLFLSSLLGIYSTFAPARKE